MYLSESPLNFFFSFFFFLRKQKKKTEKEKEKVKEKEKEKIWKRWKTRKTGVGARRNPKESKKSFR